ncbi:SRPBCC domain-containing protein [Amycolatopsis albispora]|uniref:Activator of Hsp90 ATPase homologue 1/2-like C-terminal domain-containing protein n=1 Tax=Amycolatopsis albispora TaxID=1804986 RepID=A0A344L1Y6_9PSEU|nr:SRPBCC domain-containing protein [Amycolatopsis albispora]AXB42060.1 hypothetical protein A4R43_05560 [Amycolatopsis albispora]
MTELEVRVQDGNLLFTRGYPHEVARVWRALTDDGELSVWTPWRVRADMVPGGVLSVAFGKGKPTKGEVLTVEPERRLVWRCYGALLDWTLDPEDGGCRLGFATTIGDPGHVAQSAAGYHISLDNLALLLDGQDVVKAPSPPREPRFPGLVRHYTAAL